MTNIFVDADACSVKNEVYRVADRYKLGVTLVANSRMRIPIQENITLKIVGKELDAADDWIAGHIQPGDIVITADIPLASRCLEKGARAIGNNGRPFTEDNISDSIATRELLAELREAGEITGGPAPMTNRDRSFFLQKLDETIHSVRRESK